MEFPLGKTGGLIEARIQELHLLSGITPFPLGKTGGLIEARALPPDPSFRRWFPLGKTGGLIEARGTATHARRSTIVSAG